MIIPENKAIVKLSSTGKGRSSVMVAAIAPEKITSQDRLILVKFIITPIIKQVKKNARLPSRVRVPINFVRPNLRPKTIEAVSPKIRNNREAMAISFLNKITVNRVDIKNNVVVKKLFLSFSFKIFLKILKKISLNPGTENRNISNTIKISKNGMIMRIVVILLLK